MLSWKQPQRGQTYRTKKPATSEEFRGLGGRGFRQAERRSASFQNHVDLAPIPQYESAYSFTDESMANS